MKQAVVVFDMHHTLFKKAGAKGDQVEPMPRAMEVFLDFYQTGYKIVIISSSIIQHSRQTLERLLTQQGVSEPERAEIFDQIDILTMQYFGTKYDSAAWKEAMSPYTNIEYIFEDGEEKLKAAGEAARELGSDPELYQSVKEFEL